MPLEKDIIKKGKKAAPATAAPEASQETPKPETKIKGLSRYLEQNSITSEELKSLSEWGFYERDHVYTMREPNETMVPISNFTMEVLYHIRSKTDAKRIVKITNCFGLENQVEFSTSDMVSLEKFKCKVESEGNYLFWGKPQHLSKIKGKLYQEECSSKEITTLGWQADSKTYAFCNGLYNCEFHKIDEYGIVKLEGKNYFLPTMSKINIEFLEDFAAERKFFYQPAGIDFRAWSKLLYQVYGDNGAIGLAFYMSAVFRDVVYARLNFFPLLFLFGAPRTGKSTMARSFMSMFGFPQEPFMLGTPGTQKAFMRMFAQFRNAMVWLDEYKNSIDQRMIESIKPIYDGTGYSRATFSNDNRTKTTPVLSACILSGQEMPTAEPALFSRTILLQFVESKWQNDQLTRFNQLTELERNGLSSVTTDLLPHRKHIEDNFSDAFDVAVDEFNKIEGLQSLPDRLIKNCAIIYTVFKLMEKVLNLPFTSDHLRQLLVANIVSQNAIINTSDDMARFWKIVLYLFEQNEIAEDVDFKFKGERLYMRFSRIHPLYLEYYRRLYNQRGIDESSLMQYIKNDKSTFIESKGGVRFGLSAPTYCYVFDANALPIKLKKESEYGQDAEDLPNNQSAPKEIKVLNKQMQIEGDVPF